MQRNEYITKKRQLDVLLNNLNDVCARATKNSLYSDWHKDLLNRTRTLVDEINNIAIAIGEPTINVDYSQYIFKPSQLSIEGLTQSYEYYIDMKNEYDNTLLPQYYSIMEEYNQGRISYDDYKDRAEHILESYKVLSNSRIELMENIRLATIEDYQKVPKDEVDKFLSDLATYNNQLKYYEEKYKEWEQQKITDPTKAASTYVVLERLYTQLSNDRPNLSKRRGLIYNTKTLNDLKRQKNMIEDIIKDSTNTQDYEFEQKRALYEGKKDEIEALIKEIERFKKAVTVSKIKPLNPVQSPVQKHGDGGKKQNPKKKASKPKQKKGNQNRDYEFDAINEPSFLGPTATIHQTTITPPPKQNKYFNLEELIAKILYGNPPDDSIHYKKIDNFIYMNKDIKLINFPKSHGVSILDKPMKLAKTMVSAVVRGIGKLCAKVANLNKNRRKTIDGLLQRIEQLTSEEIEFLANNFTANRMTELSKAIPEVAMSALNNRIALHFNSKLDIVNQKIYEYYKEIIRKFDRYSEILELINNGNPTPTALQALQLEQNNLDKELCQDIIGLEEQKAYASDLNKSGAMSFIENWKIRHNSSAGGRNISKKVNEDSIKAYNYTKIAENVRNGNGYLAAKDFLYGEKIKIAGTKTSHKMKNWFHKTRVGAYEFKPFVELSDYSADTYWSDVLSTIAIAASIQNMMYVNQLKSELVAAQQKITTLDATIAAQQQEIAQLNQQIQNYNQYIVHFNQQIQANNQAIKDLQQIFTLYSTDPGKFVDKMTEFALIENSKVHGLTEYTMQMADAGKAGRTALKSSGPIYSAFDNKGHLFSKDICDKINNISNNTTLTAQQKASQIANVLGGVNQNLAATVAAGKADLLKGLAMPANGQWSFDAFSYAVNNIATYDSTFVPSVFESFVNAAVKSKSLAVINNLLPVNVTSITQLQQLAVTIPTVDLLPAIVGLSTLVGKDTILAIAESYREPSKKHSQSNWREKTDELAESIKGVEIDLEQEAKRIFNEREAEWKKKGPIYRLTHKKQKPTMEQAYAEASKNAGLGRSI